MPDRDQRTDDRRPVPPLHTLPLLAAMRGGLRSTAVRVAALFVALAVALSGSAASARTDSPAPVSARDDDDDDEGARLSIVFVLHGLRPDSINPTDTPNLHRLRGTGVNFPNSHAVVPTVTRVNAPSISTGTFPGTHGIVGNAMYVPGVNPTRTFSTGDAASLLKLRDADGRIVLTRTLAQRLEEEGKRLVSVSSGSSGSALLLTPTSVDGTGAMINVRSGAVPFTFPSSMGDEIVRRLGPPPAESAVDDSAKVDYQTRVIAEYALPELRPDVLLSWMTEPDGAQHEHAAGSPQALATIRNDDRNIGVILDRLATLGLADETDIYVVSDHGFSLHTFGVNVEQELIAAGLKASASSDDVVVANTGSVLVYVKHRDPKRIEEIVRFLQTREWSDTIYTAHKRPSDGRYRTSGNPRTDGRKVAQGWVPGMFSLELIHEANPQRAADILLTLPWTSERNAFGVRGTSYNATGGRTGPTTGPGSGHGSFSPWDVRNTFFAWGASFRDGKSSPAPAGNVDIAPTILKLEDVSGSKELDGRVLKEAIYDGPDPEDVEYRTRVLTTEARGGEYYAIVKYSEAGGTRYIDTSLRLP